MGCGCGGSKRQAQATQQRRAESGSGQKEQARPTGGYVWEAPKRTPKPQAS